MSKQALLGALLFNCNMKISSDSEVLQEQRVHRYSSTIPCVIDLTLILFPDFQFSASTVSLHLLTKRLKDARRRFDLG